jgi:hypothetical protein
MNWRTLRAPLAGATLVLVAVFAAQPALADTELGDSGHVGAHSLTDTHAQPGVTCNYKYSSSLGVGKITKLTVRPPNMDLAPGRTHQIIGWSFTIDRRRVGEQNTAYKHYYTSPLQTTSIGGESGGFSSMSTPITFPPNDGITGVHHYRVTVKMVWFAKDGETVSGTSRHRVDFYKGVENTGQHWVDNEWCASVSPS